jgi:hypothetical protein
MLAVIEETSEALACTPVCLHWQENPHRLVSLWDMLQVATDRYLEMGRAMHEWMHGLPARATPNHPINDEHYKAFVSTMTMLQLHSSQLGLSVTEQLLGDKLRSLKGIELTHGITAAAIGEVYRCFLAELKSQAFFFIPKHRARFYSDLVVEWSDPVAQGPEIRVSPFFHATIATAFPSAIYDMREAGNCYAVSRNTACVFHLMRVLEIALGALGSVFGVSLAHTNWAPAIDEIEKKIREMHKDPIWRALPDCKEQQEFYAQAASHFAVLKDAWRNYTAHVRGRYDEDEAESILRNIRDLMQKLATRLHE